MGRARQRLTREYLEETPEFDPTTAEIARVLEIRGKGLVLLSTGDDERTTLAVLPPKFRGTLWLRRGALVIAKEIPTGTAENKVTLSIEHLLNKDDIKQFTKQNLIPEAFLRKGESETETEPESDVSEDESDCIEG